MWGGRGRGEKPLINEGIEKEGCCGKKAELGGGKKISEMDCKGKGVAYVVKPPALVQVVGKEVGNCRPRKIKAALCEKKGEMDRGLAKKK